MKRKKVKQLKKYESRANKYINLREKKTHEIVSLQKNQKLKTIFKKTTHLIYTILKEPWFKVLDKTKVSRKK